MISTLRNQAVQYPNSFLPMLNLGAQEGLSLSYFFQRNCGCPFNTPCYWSSAPNSDPDSDEYLDFQIQTGQLVAITGFSLTPYQSTFQPQQPVYAPHHAILQIVLPNGHVGYSSTAAVVENKFEQQTFYLDKTLLFLALPGSLIRLRLCGRQQRQTVQVGEGAGDGALNDFYTCISYAEVLGQVIHGVTVAAGTALEYETVVSCT